MSPVRLAHVNVRTCPNSVNNARGARNKLSSMFDQAYYLTGLWFSDEPLRMYLRAYLAKKIKQIKKNYGGTQAFFYDVIMREHHFSLSLLVEISC